MQLISSSALLAAIPIAAVLVDADLTIVESNGPGRDLLGRSADASPEGAAGRSVLDSVPPNERQSLEAVLTAVRAATESEGTSEWPRQQIELSRPQNGGVVAIQLVISPLQDSDGKLVGFLLTSTRFSSRPLGSRQPGDHDAARMDVARQLAATLNHEINNPLFVVSATLEDLLAETEDAAELRRLNAALEAVWRVSSAVKQLSEIRQLVSTAYIEGFPMIDLEASQARPESP